MLIPVLLMLVLQLTRGLGQGSFNFRHYCTIEHSASKYKVSCNGNQYFKDKNMVLDSRNTKGITAIDMYSFASITIDSKTASGWNTVKKITIRNCSKIMFNSQHLIQLDELQIDTADVLLIESEPPHYVLDSKAIVLSNIGSIEFTSNKTKVKGERFNIFNVYNANFHDELNLLGMQLIISQSNIDLMTHASLNLTFESITFQASTKLYIQESSLLNLLSDNILIQESYIYIEGNIEILSNKILEDRKDIKFINSSIYGMEEKNFHINRNYNDFIFIGNGFYRSDISSIMTLIDSMEGVTFSKNDFNCNECKNGQLLQSKYLGNIGESNFCDVSCNLSLSRFKALLDEGEICGQSEFHVNDETLCSTNRISLIKFTISIHSWWITPVIVISLIFLSLFLFFYFRRNPPRFKSVSAKTTVPDYELHHRQDCQKEQRAFCNELYGKVNSSENIYEIVDSP